MNAPHPDASDPPLAFWEQHATAVTWLFVGLGLTLRLVRYVLRFPLWGDEAMVAENLLDRGYVELLRPLDYGQSCPLFFLWAQLTLVKLWGFHEFSLRLVPTLCSLASVVLFRDFAARLLRGLPLVLAVAVFAVSYYPIRHGAEVKPYAGDLLAALLMLWLAVRWLAQPERRAWLWALAAVAPLCLGMSLPAAFVAGGVSLALLVRVWRQADRAAWLAYAACNVAVVGSFAALYFAFLRPHLAAVGEAATTFHWPNAFPPLTEPWKLLVWLVSTHTGHMVAYPIGGGRGGSALTAVMCLVALIVLCRQRRFEIAALAVLPLGVALVAAALHKYPYGQSARIMQYAAPAVCLLFGLGLATVVAWWRRGAAARRMALVSVVGLTAFGLAGLGRDLVWPFKTPLDRDHRDFARWFWTSQGRDVELLCAATDLGLDFRYVPSGSQRPRDLFSPEYLCNQRIYRHPEPAAARVERAKQSGRLVRVVVHHGQWEMADDFAVMEWAQTFPAQQAWELIRVSSLRVNPGQGRVYEQVYQVYDFVPRAESQGSGARSQENRISLTSDSWLPIPAPDS
jgi:hypothetical protein